MRIGSSGNVLVGTTVARSKLTVSATGSTDVASFIRSDLGGGSTSGATGLHLGDAGSGVVVLAREKTNINTADTVIYGEHGYNTQDERIRASRDLLNFKVAGSNRVKFDTVGAKIQDFNIRYTVTPGYNTTYDTGISVSNGSRAKTLLVLMTGHTSAGMNTQNAMYLVRLGYDGNHDPVSEKIGGNYTITVGRSASNTVTLHTVSIPVYQIIELGL